MQLLGGVRAPGSRPSGGRGSCAICASISSRSPAALGAVGVGSAPGPSRGRRRGPSPARASRARSAGGGLPYALTRSSSSISRRASTGRSSVDASEDRVEHRQRRDHVGDVAPSTMCESACRLTKRGSRMCTRAGLEEPSERTKQPSSPRGDSIGVVDLARRHAEALGDELEVMDQRLHRGGELVARRQRDLAVLGDVRALGQPVERLLDDLAPTRTSRPGARRSGRSCRRPCRPGS